MLPRLLLVLLLFPVVCLAQSQTVTNPSRTRTPLEGSKIFQQHCASCHGTDARGHGPASTALKHSIPDLTLISQRNGGKFPYQRIKDLIEGTQPAPPAHGNREMPTWGPIFHQVESDQDWGEVRLDAITKHVESIQQK
jgi:mono/diheme cytochrome c family protein